MIIFLLLMFAAIASALWVADGLCRLLERLCKK